MTSLSKYEMVDGGNKKQRHKKAKKRSKRRGPSVSSSEEDEVRFVVCLYIDLVYRSVMDLCITVIHI